MYDFVDLCVSPTLDLIEGVLKCTISLHDCSVRVTFCVWNVLGVVGDAWVSVSSLQGILCAPITFYPFCKIAHKINIFMISAYYEMPTNEASQLYSKSRGYEIQLRTGLLDFTQKYINKQANKYCYVQEVSKNVPLKALNVLCRQTSLPGIFLKSLLFKFKIFITLKNQLE